MAVPGFDPTYPYGSDLVTVPYVSVASFKAFPSYAELDNLVTGVISQAQNDAALNNLLIESSQWATDQANLPLHGTRKVENKILRVQRNGTISWHPTRNPVKSIVGMQYSYAGNLGASGSVQTVTDLTGVWIEESAQVNLGFGALGGTLGGLQFGLPVGSNTPLYTSWWYEAGFPHALLGAPTIAGATSITVSDPSALVVGDRLRIWDPAGGEEACQVGAGYVVGSTTVPLASALVNAHSAGVTVSAIPSSVQLAVVYYTCALLMRPDSRAEDQYPDTRSGITTRSEDARRDGTGLVAEAYRQLRSYARTR